MNNPLKKLRYYWWLARSFVAKNVRLILTSAISSFFVIFLIVNFFPFLNSIVLKKHERIGIIGRFNLRSLNLLPGELTGLLSNPLIAVDEKGELIPVLVNSWEITEGKTYRLHLKSNLYWNDGKKFTASDIDLKFKGIQKRVIDEATVEFILNEPLSNFPVYLTKPLIRYPLKGVAGLYQVGSIRSEKDNIISISLFPNKKDLPLKTYYFYEGEDDLSTAFKKGEINTIKTSKSVIADYFKKWKNSTVTRGVNYGQIMTIFFNTARGITSEKDVRKALIYSVPPLDKFGEQASGPIPPTSWGYSKNVKKYGFDPGKAKAMLDKTKVATSAGTLNIYTFYDYAATAQKVRQGFEALGLKTNLRILSFVPDDFDILITLWSPPTDPDQYYFWHSTQKDENKTKFKNVKVDKLLEDGRKKTNLDDRRQIYADFQKIIMEEVPAFFLYHPYIYTIERK